ncbi:MAG TPA: cyanophycinase [Chitinophagales bacterium]|nr:cyanophycinase [Chitinophagales bacterium]
MIPKGKLIAIGGAEDKGTDKDLFAVHKNNPNYSELGVLRRIVAEAGGKDAHIEVITTASSIPGEVWRNYNNAFAKLGCTNVGHMRIRKPKDADNEDILARLKACDAVMFSGGDQSKIVSTFNLSAFFDILKQRYKEGNFVIAGTSAGAMAMSHIMIRDGNAAVSLLKGEVKNGIGLGFVDQVIIDSHVNKRGRFTRLAQMVALHPTLTGIGLGEDTGVIITNDSDLEVIGSGAVMIVDGSHVVYNNIAHISDGCPISLEDLRVHILQMGNLYNCKTKKITV